MSDESVPFKDASFDEFWLTGLFPEAKKLFAVHQKPIADIKTDCLVALDANVLLLPYELGSSSFSKIAEIYKVLAGENRLLVPAHAAREFVKNRAAKLRDLVKYINDQASSLSFSLHEQISFLADEESFKNIKKQSEEIEKSRKKILSEASSINEKISRNVGSDPVSYAYREILGNAVYEIDCSGDAADKLRTDALWRYTHRVPPGYKDRGKDDGGLGDLIIWKTLLSAGSDKDKDLIFVTKDVKGDWWVQSQGAFQPRFELIEEYYRTTNGRTLHLISLSQLLEIFEAAKETVSDVRRAEDSAVQRTLTRNFLGKLSEASPSLDDEGLSFVGYALAHLFAEKRQLDREIVENLAEARPIRARLDAAESLPEDEIRLLVRKDRQLRATRSRHRQRIALIDREIARRAASDDTELDQ